MRGLLIVTVLFTACNGRSSAATLSTADNVLDVFADGQYFGQKQWSTGHAAAKSFDVPSSARVIGLKGIDYGGLGGIIASGAGISTDNTWKCSNRYAEGWSTAGFDDSTWAAASQYTRPDKQRPPTVASSAQWIWTANYHFGDRVVYCRMVRDSVTIAMTADNVLDLFVDGDHLGEHEWRTGHAAGVSFTIPTSAAVIGLRGVDYGGLGGIIASTSDGIKTDASWKCSNTYSEGWSTAGFDDSSWAAATAYSRPDGQMPPEVDSSAKWIWTGNYHYQDKVVYCRRARAVAH